MRTKQIHLGLILLAGLILVSGSPTRAEQGAGLVEVESVLEKLEQHLLDQEGEALTFGEGRREHEGAQKNPAKTVYQYKKSRVGGALPESDRMREIAAAVAALDGEVAKLTADVQRSKQKIVEQAKVNNFIELEAHLEDTDVAAIRTLRVQIDGYEIYALDDAAGVWTPTKSLPLYAGPLLPGNHRLDVEVRIGMRSSKSLPISADIYRFVNKSFEIQIPDGTFKRKWAIKITPPETTDGNPKAELVQVGSKL